MAELVALDLPLGAQLRDEIQRAYEQGHAVCVIDSRWSASRRRELMSVLGPTLIVDSSLEVRRWSEGHPVSDGDGLVVLTSGSSGPPKAAILTWAAVAASATMTSTALQRSRPTRWNACLPPVHVGGFAVVARSLFTSDDIVFSPSGNLTEDARQGATHVAVVRPQLARFDLHEYDVVLLGGGRPPAERPTNVVTTWGLTETGSGVVYDGRPLPGVQLAISDGEILVRSPTLLRAYRHDPAPFVRGPDGATNWFATGDEGTLVDGTLRVHGRRQFVINTGGEKVWPDDLEAALATVPRVTSVAVAGVADAEWGDMVVALVQSDATASQLASAFRDAAREHLGPWAVPKKIFVVEEIPRTPNGKIRRDAVASMVTSLLR